jgi:hypothetical protein
MTHDTANLRKQLRTLIEARPGMHDPDLLEEIDEEIEALTEYITDLEVMAKTPPEQ